MWLQNTCKLNQAHENANGSHLTETALSVSKGQEEWQRYKVQYLAEIAKPPLHHLFSPIQLRHLLETECLHEQH